MLKVAIIDDEFYFRSSLISNIPWEQNGMSVVADANDGVSGEHVLLTHRPDIALVDINMPAQSGLKLIERANAMGVDCRYVILSGYDDFAYAQQAVALGVSNYILKPVDYGDLLKALNRLKQQIIEARSSQHKLSQLERANALLQRDLAFSDLVNFRLPPTEDARRALLSAPYDYYAAAVFQARRDAGRAAAERMRDAFARVNPGQACEAFIDANNRLVAVADVRSIEQLNQLLDALMGALALGGEPPDVGVGRIYATFDQLYRSYNEACMALRNHLIYPDLMRERHQSKGAEPQGDHRARLRGYVRSADRERAVEALQQIYAQLYNTKAPYDLVVLGTLELMALLVSVLDRLGIGHEGLLRGELSLLDEMDQMKTVSEFCGWITDRYRQGMRMIEGRKRADGPIADLISHIHAHLGDSNLSVASLSKELFMNYSYVCYAFKRDMGVTVNEYITSQRMERAKDLFLEGQRNIAYVASLVGYDDANYFSKSFKKKEGMTPSEFLKARD